MESLSVKKCKRDLYTAGALCVVMILLAMRMIFCGVLYSLHDRVFMGLLIICVLWVFVSGFCVSYDLSGKSITEKNIFGRCIKSTDAQSIKIITYYTKDITTFRRARREKYIRLLLCDDTECLIPYDDGLWECMNVIYSDKIM